MNMEKLARLRGKITAARYGNPGRALSVIVVIGDYGKTTTALLLGDILKQAGRKVKVITNDMPTYPTSIDGVQRMLFFAKKDGFESIILEATEEMVQCGALLPLTIDSLVVTSPSPSLQPVLALVPKHVIAPSEIEIPSGLVEPYKRISFGDDDTAEAKIDTVKLYRKGTEVTMTIDHQTKLELATYLIGKSNAYNVAAAVAAGYVLAVDLEAVKEGCADLETVWGNFIKLQADTPYQVIVDGAHADVSVSRVVSSVKQFAKRRLIVVLGDFDIAKEAIDYASDQADRCFVVANGRELPRGTEAVQDVMMAAQKAFRSAKKDDVVLLAGRVFTIKTDDGRLYGETLLEADSHA